MSVVKLKKKLILRFALEKQCCIDSVHHEIDIFFHFFLVNQLHYLVVEPGSPPLLH